MKVPLTTVTSDSDVVLGWARDALCAPVREEALRTLSVGIAFVVAVTLTVESFAPFVIVAGSDVVGGALAGELGRPFSTQGSAAVFPLLLD